MIKQPLIKPGQGTISCFVSDLQNDVPVFCIICLKVTKPLALVTIDLLTTKKSCNIDQHRVTIFKALTEVETTNIKFSWVAEKRKVYVVLLSSGSLRINFYKSIFTQALISPNEWMTLFIESSWIQLPDILLSAWSLKSHSI